MEEVFIVLIAVFRLHAIIQHVTCLSETLTLNLNV